MSDSDAPMSKDELYKILSVPFTFRAAIECKSCGKTVRAWTYEDLCFACDEKKYDNDTGE